MNDTIYSTGTSRRKAFPATVAKSIQQRRLERARRLDREADALCQLGFLQEAERRSWLAVSLREAPV